MSKDYNDEQIEKDKIKQKLKNAKINQKIIKIENIDNSIKNIKNEVKQYIKKK